MGKEVISRLSFCLESFQMKANGEHKFLLFFSSVNYRRIYSIHLKNSCFVEDVLFYLRNEVMAFPKIETGVTTSRATSGDRKNDPNMSGQR